MLGTSSEEQDLLNELLEQPRRHGYRWHASADRELREILFRSLAKRRDDYLRQFFPAGPPTDSSESWSLRTAQGAVDGAEYTEAAKGTACGHIFKTGESTYHCKTCAADDTCVLCARCFESSDHDGHAVFISVSPGNSGCCDCGDSEAWRREVKCTIHSADFVLRNDTEGRNNAKDKAPAGLVGRDLPMDLVESIRMTISRAVDYLCDVFSCSPEQLRLPKSEESIRNGEQLARLAGLYGVDGQEDEPEKETEYALILWNDEKHTMYEVTNQVARACKRSKRFGESKAMEVHEIGRSIIHYSTDLKELLRMAGVIEQLRVTVTIRSSRDTFREEMCATIIDWISDIAGCSVGNDAQILRTVVCQEFLKPWRTGSLASNKEIGKEGIDDHELEDNDKLQRHYRSIIRPLQPAANVVRVAIDIGGITADYDTIDGNDDEDDDDDQMDYEEDEDVDIEIDDPGDFTNATLTAADADMDMDFENEDMTEALEATIAGYPPPPPPPNTSRRRRILISAESDEGDPDQGRPASDEPYSNVPKTPKARTGKQRPLRPSRHWLEKPQGFKGPRPQEACEDLWQRVRLDYLILYDLRLWKTLRINLRHLYITTVVTIPHFKRLLGLRFAGLYTALAQLYLVADREPDHSIINLSIQMLTTPTITQEVVERGNFLTNLMAILYTFLTTRQVGFPEDVGPRATLAFDAGAVANRRMFHFFLDLRWLFQSDFIHYRMRVEPHYLLQFVDLVKLHQGVCPNTRATSEHVEYESDTWISASMIVKEINKLCKQAAVSFEPNAEIDAMNLHLQRAIRTVAQITMINSVGAERRRFIAGELNSTLTWHYVGWFEDSKTLYRVPQHVVQSEPMSFHHPLHYLLSWLLENAKGLSREEVRTLLRFSTDDLKDPWNNTRAPTVPSDLTSADLMLAILDQPLRVCVWLAQMKAGMWVRNGITLRHQAHTYRSVSYRDVGYQRDILMIQAGLVLCGADRERPGERFLAQMIDRFQMTGWFQGTPLTVDGFEESQQIDVLEDFYHLLVVALCERSNLIPMEDRKEQHDRLLQHDIAHVLCFKPLSYSELTNRLTEKIHDSDNFGQVLETMTLYRAPEGLSDTGTFELKPEYISLVDPYFAHYSRNQREEAENIYKKHMAKRSSSAVEDVVYEPTLQPISAGLFSSLSAFTSTTLFVQVIATGLSYAVKFPSMQSQLQVTRIETFLHMVLHLALLATNEDVAHGRDFIKLATTPQNHSSAEPASVVSLLITLSSMEEYASCHPIIKRILAKMQVQQPEKLSAVLGSLALALDRGQSGSPASLSQDDKERKKQEALARQARVMAQMKQQQNSFLQNQGLSPFGDDFDDLDDMSVSEEPENVEQKKLWNFPAGTCIWCQEETDDQRLYGTFAFLGESNILRTTPLHDKSYIQEIFDTPDSLDRSADAIRPFGVAGRNKRMIRKVGSGGKVVESERQGLSKGFPQHECSVTGPVATTCGHIMHYSCFELYMHHSLRRHQQQIARNHPENITLKEFTCPLCKALGNAFLPIIWKAKECAQEYELHAAKRFDDWIEEATDNYATDSAAWSEGLRVVNRPSHAQQLSDRSSHYINDTFAPSLVAAMNDLSLQQTQPQSIPTPVPPRRTSSGLMSALFRRRSSSSQDNAGSSAAAVVPEQLSRMAELAQAYQRIDETIKQNELADPESDTVTTLSRSLGMSISAFEIAHRGTSNGIPGTSLLVDIPEQALTHFRILSETIESYLAVNVMRPTPLKPIFHDTGRMRDTLNAQLFGGSENDQDLGTTGSGSMLFRDDTFLFFVDWLSYMAPTVAEASNVLQLCLWAEVVKTMLVYDAGRLHTLGAEVNQAGGGQHAKSELYVMAHSIVADRLPQFGHPAYVLSRYCTGILARLIEKYALAFLRKAIVVMYVRYGLDYECPYDVDTEAPELERLTKLLHLQPVEATMQLLCSDSQAGHALTNLTQRWATQAARAMAQAGDARRLNTIKLPHPAIFELVGLPMTYDTLTEEAIHRRCPTTGKEINDPAVCLFCGEIFCSQATCCTTEKFKGGCYKHVLKCGGKVGIFINIRKCMILFAHGPGQGSFAHAPYLDKHGEPDPTLRRHHQLFLNQKRYDKLMREVWLHHLIPTVISRKLEVDSNPGGWETL